MNMSNQKTLLDFQSDWVELVSKAMSDYNSLSKNERIWFNVESLIGQVNNGGLISHYYNSGADNNKDAIEDLISLWLPNVADLLVEMNKLFPCGKHFNRHKRKKPCYIELARWQIQLFHGPTG